MSRLRGFQVSIRGLLLVTVLFAIAIVLVSNYVAERNKAQILISLESTDRNTVHVALCTLRANDIQTPTVDFDSPYKDVAADLKSLQEKVAKLDRSVLENLDQSLDYHWKIFSPIWLPEIKGFDNTPANWE